MMERLMNTFLRKPHPLPAADSRRTKAARKSRGQSLVEFAIAFPIIILLFSGLIEFGFILNYYLSLLDATREAARFYSNLDPFNEDGSDKMSFYQDTAAWVIGSLQPQDVNDTSRKITLDSSTDDVIVSVFSVSGTTVTRYPTAGDFRWFGNRTSGISNAYIQSQVISDAPPAGILLVEVYYAYHQTLALPWLRPFLPDPVILHAYTMMPLSAAEPTSP
jgi:Flp pilus assembly protein TadG